jgi:alpha-beta hydrolase superfamily lysophospholipase
MMIPTLRKFAFGAGFILPLLLASCSAQAPVPPAKKVKLDKTHLHTFDGEKFAYTRWMPKEKPRTVIVGVHGISGAASDYKPLAKRVLKEFSDVAIYSAETRGQGNDPVKERRGHIGKRSDWFRDLTTFTALIRQRHPGARIIWCGESMGALIVLHAYAASEKKDQLCDAMILSSPITAIRDDFPRWKITLANIASILFPTARVSLETLSGQSEVRVTKDTVHSEQVENNSYHVKRHTLRLLTTLGKMMQTFPKAGESLDLPVIVLHGGKDVFSKSEDVKAFVDGLPEKATVTRKFYPESFHLLFFDHQSDKVVADIAKWVKELPAKE